LCREHPAEAGRIRERLAALERIGMLGEEREAHVPAAFGSYHILRRIGGGGMGTVFLARDEDNPRPVALKMGHVPVGSDVRSVLRFEREIRAVARLQHPGIVPIYDVGEAEGRAYFTMEYIPGANLAEIVRALKDGGRTFDELTPGELRGILERADPDSKAGGSHGRDADHPWPRTYVECVCRWVLEVAEALDHVHGHGIVHRDVKPSNVMIGRDGRARVFDLGLARLEDQPSLTRSGDFTGTPYYVSPEQISGRVGEVDRRSDVYSLGVTLFELLALCRPFEGRTTQQVLKRIQTAEPPLLRRLNPLVPRDLETLCLAAIEKDPACRYQTMGELASDLRRFLEFKPVRARPVGLARRGLRTVRRNPSLAAALGLTALVAVGVPIGLLWANSAIRKQRDRANLAADEAVAQARLSSRVVEYLVDLFRPPEGGLEHPESVPAGQLLRAGVARIPNEFEDQPLVRAALMDAMGRVYTNLGLIHTALPLLDRSFAIRHRELGEEHRDAAAVLHALATVHLTAGNHDAALALCRRGLAALERSGHARDPAAADCRRTLGVAAARLGQPGLADEQWRAAIEIRRVSDGEDSRPVAVLRELLGGAALERGDFDEAERELSQALAIRRSLWTVDPLAIAADLRALARVAGDRGDEATARGRDAEAREIETTLAAPPADPKLAFPFAITPAWRPEFEALFQEGITALQAGSYGAAIESFRRGLELKPFDAPSMYNIACGHALSGRIAASLDWLESAAEHGFGQSSELLEVLHKDVDLAAARADPRFEPIVDRILARRDPAAEFSAEPGLYVPESVPEDEPWPLLVVLHARGETKHDVLAGPWKRLAEVHGLCLFAPSGTWPLGDDPADGMAWLEDPDEYPRRSWEVRQPVIERIRALCREQRVDRHRVVVAGEGSGAMLAFDLALRAPGLFHGVLLVDGPPTPGVEPHTIRTAAAVGLSVQIVLTDRGAVFGRPPERSLEELAADAQAWLEAHQLGAREPLVVRGAGVGDGLDTALKGLVSR
jgi:serine/threonine protein kinase/tetratricopeptide (TPR) repeat protein